MRRFRELRTHRELVAQLDDPAVRLDPIAGGGGGGASEAGGLAGAEVASEQLVRGLKFDLTPTAPYRRETYSFRYHFSRPSFQAVRELGGLLA